MRNPYGPLSEAEFKQAVDAPYGGAAAILQRHDPLWGKLSADGSTPIKWRVRVEQEVTMFAFLTVEAVTEEDAVAIAEERSEKSGNFSWNFDSEGSVSVIEAVPL